MEAINNKNNILWIDIAKFIAMFLVVFEHVVLAFKLNDVLLGKYKPGRHE